MNDTFSRIGLFRTLLAVVSSRILTRTAVLFSFLILGRVLGPEEFGRYAVFYSSVYIAFQFGNLGLRQAAGHIIGKSKEAEGVVVRALALVFPVCVFAFVSLVWLLSLFQSTAIADVGWAVILLAGLGAVSVSFAQGINLGRGHIGIFNFTEIVLQIVFSLLIVTVFLLSLLTNMTLNMSSAVWALVSGFLAAGAFGISRSLPFASTRGGDCSIFRMLCAMFRHGWLYALVLVFLTINSRLAVFFLGWVDPTLAGQYFLALRLSEALLEVASAIGIALFSLGARTKDPIEMMQRSAAVSRILIFLALAAALLAIIVVPWIVEQVFPGKHVIGLFPIILLAATLPFTAFNRTAYQALAGLGEAKVGGFGYAGAVLLNAGLAAALIPAFGISGAIAGFLVGQMFVMFVLLRFIRLHYGLPAQTFLILTRSDLVKIRQMSFARIWPGRT